MKIWTDSQLLEVDPFDISQLSNAMRFKYRNIRAKADPELFLAVANVLDAYERSMRMTENNRGIKNAYDIS